MPFVRVFLGYGPKAACVDIRMEFGVKRADKALCSAFYRKVHGQSTSGVCLRNG